MLNQNIQSPTLCVVGLGYVGLPLSVALGKHFSVVGFDINSKRIEDLKEGIDRTQEVSASELRGSSLHMTNDVRELAGHDVYIVTVPTPIDDRNHPDLNPLIKASEMIGPYLSKGSVVVYESTVYPGVTEDICGPILEKMSHLIAGKDFFLGYSPERINPGDKVHTVDKITKVVSGQTPDVTNFLPMIYGRINGDNIFKASNIKTAEAAKVIENTQRDINIAFINEITGIFMKLGISIHDVLEAAGTKWNFLNFKPGLVGGHCIGVDPYYLAHLSKQLSHEPEIILAGRKTNESMSAQIAEALGKQLPSTSRILVLGLTFKENIPDLRNTKVIDLIRSLKELGHRVDVHDPHADPLEAKALFHIDLCPNLDVAETYDCLLGAVAHKEYLEFTEHSFPKLVKEQGLIADIKNMWSSLDTGRYTYWRL